MLASPPDGSPALLPTLPRGTVTFLFTDIQGSTRLLEQLREQYALVLADQRDLLRAAFAAHGGHEIDTQGDSFFVAFARALDAVACVAAAQHQLAAHAWPQGAAVRVRMGLHTGEPIIGRTGYVGMDVHRAARIAAAGHGGQVLLSQTTRDLIYQDLPPGLSLRSLGEHKLKDIRFPQPLSQLVMEGLPADFPPLKTGLTGDEPPAPGEPPFMGLLFFDQADAARFFGRQEVTDRLAARLLAERFLAVIGASGSGKSSVVRAGLVPALQRSRQARWQIQVLTPTAHPLEALATSLTRGASSPAATARLLDDLRREPRSLHLHTHQRLQLDQRGQPGAAPARVLVVVDQFEELFTLCRDEAERARFVENLLLAAAADGGGVTVLLTLRADFYEHLAVFPALCEAVAKHQEYLLAMTAAELRQAIEGPAQQGGWEFSPGLVDLMLHDVGAVEGRQPEPGALPLLSHALLETWQRRRGHLMNLKAYSEAGGVRGAIARTAEGVFSQALTPEQQIIARNIFLRLTELGEGTQDTRRRARLDELLPDAEANPRQLEEVLEHLAAARLITTGESTIEVAHEALIREWPTLRQWLDADREGLRQHRHLTDAAQSWAGLGRDRGELYRGARLAQVAEWAALNASALNALEREFLAASQAAAEGEAAEREAQRQRELEAAQRIATGAQKLAAAEARSSAQLRRRALYLLGALVLALTAAGAAVLFGQRASQNALAASHNLATAQSAQATSAAEALARATQQTAAEQNFVHAEAQRLAAEANKLQLTGGSAEVAALLTIRSLTLQYTPQGDAALLTAASLDYPVRIFDAGDGVRIPQSGFSNDGRWVMAATTVGVRLWDRETGAVVLSLDWPPDEFGTPVRVYKAFFTPNDQYLIINRTDPTSPPPGIILQAFEVATGEEIWRQDYPICGGPPRWQDPFTVLLACGDQTGRTLNANTGAPGQPWAFESGTELFSPDGTSRLEFSPETDDLRLVRFDTGEVLLELPNDDAFQSAAMAPGSDLLAIGRASGRVELWRIATGERLQVLTGHTNLVYSVVFSPDGQQLLTTGDDQTVRLWDWQTGVEVRRVAEHAGGFFLKAAFSPDGQFILTSGDDLLVRLWTTTPRGQYPVFTGHQGLIAGLDITPDGRQAATGGGDAAAQLWDLATGQSLRSYPTADLINYGLKLSRDGRQLVTADWSANLVLWDVASGAELRRFDTTGIGGLNNVVFSPDGAFILAVGWSAVAGADASDVVAWDAHTGVEIHRLVVPGTDALYALDISPDGEWFTTSGTPVGGSAPGTVWLGNLRTGAIEPWLVGDGGVLSTRFSPDGLTLLTAGANAQLWEVATGRELQRFIGHTNGLFYAAFSPDGQLVATAGLDNTARLWDAASGQELRRYVGHTLALENVIFTPDGQRLITASDDHTARIWDVDYADTIAYLCGRLLRDLTGSEREQYGILDTGPTCPSP